MVMQIGNKFKPVIKIQYWLAVYHTWILSPVEIGYHSPKFIGNYYM